MLTPENLIRTSDLVIPYRLRAIAFGKTAISLEKKHTINAVVELKIGVEPKSEYRGFLGEFTQPLVSCAIFHSRCLLEFLGLTLDKSAKQLNVTASNRARQKGDIGIEHFFNRDGVNLQKLTRESAFEILDRADDFDVLTQAWGETFAAANQRLAHLTNDELLGGKHAGDAFELAFVSIPELVLRAFYDESGKQRPNIV
ncbi:hypothetical protein ACO0K2_13505 [Undibacterium sp. MH2W]|uniref:hypothetical protein n=1 Tax=Undibacterium sp. MH2W TaxID=3413044 RepID=UPI003BEFE5EC